MPGDHLWKKGVSGNPGGRPKGLADLKAACQLRTEENLEILDRIKRNPKSKSSDVIKCIEIQLERAYGKAIQELKGGPSDEFTRAWTAIIDRAANIDQRGKVNFRSKAKGKA